MENQMMPTIDVREMALKWTTKREVYRVLTTTAGVYLPSIDQINWDFVRDILSWDKLVRRDIYFEVYRLKKRKDNWSSTRRRLVNSGYITICKESLRDRFVYAGIWMRKISFQKMDIKCWYEAKV